MKYVTVPGTHGWSDTKPWWVADAPLVAYLRETFGWSLLWPDDPFVWSSDLQGVPLFGVGRDWEAGGKALGYFLREVPLADRNIISHSHGLQVCLWAARYGTRINTLIDIAGPVRQDMFAVTDLARPLIGCWVHAYDERSDWTAWLGQLFDGRWFGGRDHPAADQNVPLPKGVRHAGVLREPTHFPHWRAIAAARGAGV